MSKAYFNRTIIRIMLFPRYLFSRDIADVFSPTDSEALQNVFRTFGIDFDEFRPFFNAPVASQASPDEDFVVRFNIFVKIRSKSSFVSHLAMRHRCAHQPIGLRKWTEKVSGSLPGLDNLDLKLLSPKQQSLLTIYFIDLRQCDIILLL